MPVIDALRCRLRAAQLLLVLDNCEHLLDACADLAGALLCGSPGLRVLATSREPLGVPGEVVYPVPPLAVPPDQADPTAVAGAPAVRLFLDRGSTARAGGGLAGAPLAAVARICRELDGLPLAIELAAARTSVLSVEEIEAHLADKFRFLAYRRPTGDPRHQALKAAIDWSYHLLLGGGARIFREFSVFAGGFGLAQAAAVCGGGDQAAALDMVDRLAGKSLVVAETAAGGTRYRLLETIRQYAAGCLAEAGEAGQARRRHARRSLAWPSGNATWPCWPASMTTSAPRWTGRCARGRDRAAAGPRAGRLLAGPRILPGRRGAGWSARSPAPAGPAAARRPAPAAGGGAV